MANYNKERYEFIEQMFEKLDTVSVDAVVGQYVQLRQQGRHLMGYCPFHQVIHIWAALLLHLIRGFGSALPVETDMAETE